MSGTAGSVCGVKSFPFGCLLVGGGGGVTDAFFSYALAS